MLWCDATKSDSPGHVDYPGAGGEYGLQEARSKVVEAEAARDRSAYEDYVSKLSRAYATLSALDLENLDDKACDAAAMMAKSTYSEPKVREGIIGRCTRKSAAADFGANGAKAPRNI
jgi:hypothetical protein